MTVFPTSRFSPVIKNLIDDENQQWFATDDTEVTVNDHLRPPRQWESRGIHETPRLLLHDQESCRGDE